MSAQLVMGKAMTNASANPSTTNRNLLEINQAEFRENFNRQSFFIRHYLTGQQLFELPRLIELAKQLPAEFVEYNTGTIPINQDPTLTPQNGLSVEETIRRIEACRSWLVLKYVETAPEYKKLLDDCLDEIKPFSEPLAPGMRKREGFIFITSPGSVTPYHIDPEYNFLLQIRGNKTMSVWNPADRAVLSEQELEQYLSGGHRNLVYKDEYQAKAKEYHLTPGMGLHVPVTAPHWVQNGDAVSVSFSITFRNPASDRRNLIYTTNAYLRKRGLNPKPFNESRWRDEIKFNSYRVVRKIKGVLGSKK
ncbi:MAG: cupin-like domain-containing protein [Acidobacteriota bacterium]